MEKNKLAEKLNRLINDLKDLKFRQAIGGDSWVVYRTELEYMDEGGGSNGHIYQVDFQPDVGGNFVARAYWTTPDRLTNGTELAPDPNVNGRWYKVDTLFSPGVRTIFVYSTKKGKIVLTDRTATQTA